MRGEHVLDAIKNEATEEAILNSIFTSGMHCNLARSDQPNSSNRSSTLPIMLLEMRKTVTCLNENLAIRTSKMGNKCPCWSATLFIRW